MRMNTDQAAQRGIELLNELLAARSAIDGVPRSPIGVIGPKEGNDQLARDVGEVAMFIFGAQMAIPLMERLTTIGRTLEAQGAIKVDFGDAFAPKALDHLQNAAPTESCWTEFREGEDWFAGRVIWLWEASWKEPRLAIADEEEGAVWHYAKCQGIVGECGEVFPTHCFSSVPPRPPKP